MRPRLPLALRFERARPFDGAEPATAGDTGGKRGKPLDPQELQRRQVRAVFTRNAMCNALSSAGAGAFSCRPVSVLVTGKLVEKYQVRLRPLSPTTLRLHCTAQHVC